MEKLKLHKSEIILYFGVYVVYIGYQLWSLINSRHKILAIAQYEFPQGWTFLNSRKDDTNDEFYAFTEYIKQYWPWYIFHFTISTIIRRSNPRWQSIGFVVVTCIILSCTMKLISIALICSLVISYYLVAQKHSKVYVWLLSLLWMVVMIFMKSNKILRENMGYMEFHYVMVTLCWCILRGCSYGLQLAKCIANREPDIERKYSFVNFLGYSFYFPCFTLGPFMGYHRYTPSDEIACEKFTFKLFLWHIARVAFWWLVLEIAIHYVYVHYMALDIEAIKVLDTKFGLYAVGYFMGQFFFMHYIIVYGLGIAFAQYDGLRPPRKPRCIGLVHHYSDMWKYFDEGLYEFLFTHIYAELCSKNSSALRKILSTAATFSFVFLWHGHYWYVFVWSLLNFICLVLEKVLKTLTSSLWYNKVMRENCGLGEGGIQRFNAFLGSQIFIPAAFSNCYFISGLDVGHFLIHEAYLGGWWNYVTLSFCTYCFYQCCEIVQHNRHESNRK
ncbi:protein-cysteine N-palmitoyltransferase Rasp [Musca vetustissima]|uniref:protein-cysteine N-palmitoyltransferase Rasp n=1 Tax=Musca vetustissima TaxID=27455 RepID=UPI002AB6CEC8|nr:protein-cysteine N-palmitoyltransferase Rasp [Musca vetustissima]